MTFRRTPEERHALERAKATLDTLHFYPEPVNIDHVRIQLAEGYSTTNILSRIRA